jgi:hypothetical protein
MPRHQQVTTCRRSGGPISRRCTCEHCNLSICAICGAYEGGLTTDCPGTSIDWARQHEVYETCLDYTDDRGWHQGERMEHRSPRFTSTRLPPTPPRIDPRSIVAPAIDWAKIDQNKALQHELTLRAIAWTLADRQCDDLSAALVRAKTETDTLGNAPDAQLAKLERAQINFQRACQRVEECDDEFRQAARKLVDTLESPPCPLTFHPHPTSTAPRSGEIRPPENQENLDQEAQDDLRTSNGEIVRRIDLDRAAGTPGRFIGSDPTLAGYEGVRLARIALTGDQTALDEFHDRAGLVLPSTDRDSVVRLVMCPIYETILGSEGTPAHQHSETQATFQVTDQDGDNSLCIDAAMLITWILSPEGKTALARRGVNVSILNNSST